jgi:hypothetical protein
MADYYNASSEDEYERLNRTVVRRLAPTPIAQNADRWTQEHDPDDFDTWEALVRCVEAAEGGLNRSSSLKAIANMRSVYNRFLTRFPLLFGYWKKFADLEYSIAGTEAAEMVRLPRLLPATLCSAFVFVTADDVDLRARCCECSE